MKEAYHYTFFLPNLQIPHLLDPRSMVLDDFPIYQNHLHIQQVFYIHLEQANRSYVQNHFDLVQNQYNTLEQTFLVLNNLVNKDNYYRLKDV